MCISISSACFQHLQPKSCADMVIRMVYGLLIIFEYIVVIGLQTCHDTVSMLVVITSFFLKDLSIRMKFLHLFVLNSHFKSLRLIASVCLCITAPDKVVSWVDLWIFMSYFFTFPVELVCATSCGHILNYINRIMRMNFFVRYLIKQLNWGLGLCFGWSYILRFWVAKSN